MSEGRFSRKLRIVLVVIYKYRFSKFLSRLKFYFALYRGEYVETAVDPRGTCCCTDKYCLSFPHSYADLWKETMDLASIIRGYDGRRGKFLSALRAYPLADVRSLPAVKKPLILAIRKLAHELKDSAEERKIVRHLYTLCSVSADGLGSDARIAAIELLCKTGTEINHPNALRQAAALRALAALLHSAPSDTKALALNAASTAVLVVAKHLSLPQKPTKKVRRAHAEACIVSHAILYVLIAGASRAPAHVNFAADCLRSADADLARCACAYLADCAQSRARTVAARFTLSLDSWTKN